jgi:AcrR family transcriptional regulator
VVPAVTPAGPSPRRQPKPVATTNPNDPDGELGPKAARTRTAIIDAALRQFHQHGYEATTMRSIAAEAGVSVGNAYYYFASKQHLIQAFYDRTQLEHARAARAALEQTRDLSQRILAVTDAWLTVMEPYRAFAGTFFQNAAEPTSPLSPFSPESTPARHQAIELWRQVIEGSDNKITKSLRSELPELLWLYFMGIVLYWVYDPTPHAAGTRTLASRTTPIVVKVIGLARLPVLRTTLDDLLDLIRELKTIQSPNA